MLKPFYMLNGQIDLLRETKPFNWNGKEYVERTYIDENGDKAVVAIPTLERRNQCH